MAPDSPGSSLLYGPPSRRTPMPGRDPARVDAEIRALLVDEGVPLHGLLRYLRDNDLPGGPELVEFSHTVVRVAEALGEPGLSDPGLSHHLDGLRAAADTLIFRAFHRIGSPYSGKLLDRRLEDALRLGHGRDYLRERIERLMGDPRVRRRCDTILLAHDDQLGGVDHPTHLRRSEGEGPACQRAGGRDSWKMSGRARRPSCERCLELLAEDSSAVDHVPRKADDELAIYGERILLGARAGIESRLFEAAPVPDEARQELWRRSLWESWVGVMVSETRDIGGTSPLSAPMMIVRLNCFWDPDLREIKGRMPHFTI